jgi:hypothetical protein
MLRDSVVLRIPSASRIVSTSYILRRAAFKCCPCAYWRKGSGSTRPYTLPFPAVRSACSLEVVKPALALEQRILPLTEVRNRACDTARSSVIIRSYRIRKRDKVLLAHSHMFTLR